MQNNQQNSFKRNTRKIIEIGSYIVSSASLGFGGGLGLGTVEVISGVATMGMPCIVPIVYTISFGYGVYKYRSSKSDVPDPGGAQTEIERVISFSDNSSVDEQPIISQFDEGDSNYSDSAEVISCASPSISSSSSAFLPKFSTLDEQIHQFGLGVADAITAPIIMLCHPISTVKGLVNSLIHPIDTFTGVVNDFYNNPIRATANFGTRVAIGSLFNNKFPPEHGGGGSINIIKCSTGSIKKQAYTAQYSTSSKVIGVVSILESQKVQEKIGISEQDNLIRKVSSPIAINFRSYTDAYKSKIGVEPKEVEKDIGIVDQGNLTIIMRSNEELISRNVHEITSAFEREASYDLICQSIPGDGHCLYNAVALYCKQQDQQTLRNRVAGHIRTNLDEYQDLINCLGCYNGRSVNEYLTDIEVGKEWASHLEIAVLMKILDRPIIIVDSNNRIRNLSDVENNNRLMFTGEPIFVYYNGHNHYDGLILRDDINISGIGIFKKLKEGNINIRKLEKSNTTNAEVISCTSPSINSSSSAFLPKFSTLTEAEADIEQQRIVKAASNHGIPLDLSGGGQ